MHLRKIDPVAALGFVAVSLCLLALAPLGWRVGMWQYGFGLYWMMPASGFVAAAAVILSVSTLVRSWSKLCLRARVMLFIALALGAALVYVPSQYLYTRITVPSIHDITADTDRPPTFSAVLAARSAERANSVDYLGTQLTQIQKAAYPDVAPVITASPVIFFVLFVLNLIVLVIVGVARRHDGEGIGDQEAEVLRDRRDHIVAPRV
jgi:hypothetical protein